MSDLLTSSLECDAAWALLFVHLFYVNISGGADLKSIAAPP